MRALLALAASLALFAAPALARVTREPKGRTPRPPSRLEAPRLWEDAPDGASESNPAGTDGEVATFAVISPLVDSLAETRASHIARP